MTQQQTERDEALIAEVARVISRKVDSFGDTERIEQQRAQLEWPRYREHAKAAIDIIRERLRGDEPAKPDRYVEIWQEAFKAWDGLYCANDRAAAAVLRRHFEPSVEVLKAAGKVESITNSCAKNTFCSSARTLADFILKGDQ